MSLRFALTLSLLPLSCAATGDPRDDLLAVRTAPGPDGRQHVLTGQATWYGKRHHGRRTACGEPFDMRAFTAAHKTLPFHSVVRVTNAGNRKSVVVRINDRGPYARGRVIDLSRAAATDLEMRKRGKAQVTLEILEWGDGSRCAR